MNWRLAWDLGLCLFWLTLVSCDSCNTNENPSCNGNAKFEQLCCSYPSLCYWADRAGTPACCPAGQVCQAVGSVITATLPTTTVYTTPVTVATASEASTVTSYQTDLTTAVVVITESSVESKTTVVSSTVTTEVTQEYSTVTSVVTTPATSVINVLNEGDQCQASYLALVIALTVAVVQFV